MNEKSSVTNPLRKAIEARGHVAMKYHGSVYGVKGHSDIYGFLAPSGRAFFIECKVPGKKPTPEQAAFLERMERTGAFANWVDSVDGGVALIEYWATKTGVHNFPLATKNTSATMSSSSGKETGSCPKRDATSPEDAKR